MLIRYANATPNQVYWLATPDSGALHDLWLGRLRATEAVTIPAHAEAETALLFMAGRARCSAGLGERDSGQGWMAVNAFGTHAADSYNWPRGDLLVIPPAWNIEIVPVGDGVDILIFQAWLPETGRSGQPKAIGGQDARAIRQSSICLERTYTAGQRLHIGTVEHADGYGSYPLHGDGWRGEEIRVYDIAGSGEAVQRLRGQYITGAEIDAAAVVRTGDVCVLPCGDTTLLRPPNSAVFYTYAWIEET